jgi:hypothetical protein
MKNTMGLVAKIDLNLLTSFWKVIHTPFDTWEIDWWWFHKVIPCSYMSPRPFCAFLVKNIREKARYIWSRTSSTYDGQHLKSTWDRFLYMGNPLVHAASRGDAILKSRLLVRQPGTGSAGGSHSSRISCSLPYLMKYSIDTAKKW